MWAQLPNLCQESSIKLLCIHIPLCRVPGTNLWPPLSPHHSRGSCPLFSSVREAGRAVTWVTLDEGLQRAPCSFLHFVLAQVGVQLLPQSGDQPANVLQWSAQLASVWPKGSTVMLYIAGTALIELSLVLVRLFFKMKRKCLTDIVSNRKKIAPDSP